MSWQPPLRFSPRWEVAASPHSMLFALIETVRSSGQARRRHVAGLTDRPHQHAGQLRADRGVLRICGDRVELRRVGLQVEELPLRIARFIDRTGDPERLSVVVDELMAAGANADMCADPLPEMLPVPVVDVVAPVIGRATTAQRTQAAALHSFRSSYGRVVQKGLGQVEIQYQVGTDAAC